MSIFVRRYLGRSRLVEDLLEHWQVDHNDALFAQDVEALARECVELGKLTRHTWNLLVNHLFDGVILNLDEVGQTMDKSVQRTLGVFASVRKLIAEAKRRGFALECSTDFESAARETQLVMDE